jgi:hypothetical protein
MPIGTTEVPKKKKHNWMAGFVIPQRKDPLELAQLESREKVLNDLKKKSNRR